MSAKELFLGIAKAILIGLRDGMTITGGLVWLLMFIQWVAA